MKQARPLKALGYVGLGTLVVFIDVRIDGIDLIPDPLGWALVVLAFIDLRSVPRARVFLPAAVIAVCAGLASLSEWFAPDIDAFDYATAVLDAAFVFLTCTGIMEIAPTKRRDANLIRCVVLGLSLALLPLGLLGSDAELTNVLVVVAAILYLGAIVLFIWLLSQTSKLAGDRVLT